MTGAEGVSQSCLARYRCLPGSMNDYAALTAPEDRIEKVRQTVGRTIQDILLKEAQFDVYEILGSIEVLVGSKIFKGLTTSSSERMVFAFTWLAREVGTGGFHQYFINSAGDFWRDVLDGLAAIGDERGKTVFQRTLSIFPNSTPSSNRQYRLEELSALEETDDDKLSDHFNAMTKEYFTNPYPNWRLLFEYVKRHSNEFDLRNA